MRGSDHPRLVTQASTNASVAKKSSDPRNRIDVRRDAVKTHRYGRRLCRRYAMLVVRGGRSRPDASL